MGKLTCTLFYKESYQKDSKTKQCATGCYNCHEMFNAFLHGSPFVLVCLELLKVRGSHNDMYSFQPIMLLCILTLIVKYLLPFLGLILYKVTEMFVDIYFSNFPIASLCTVLDIQAVKEKVRCWLKIFCTFCLAFL